MSVIRSLEVDLGARYANLRKDFARADDLADQFARDFQSKFKDLRIDLSKSISMPAMPAIKGPEVSPLASMGADLAASLAPLASKIASTIQQATAPLNAFATDFTTKFQAVGNAIINTARRIDANYKFDVAKAAIAKWRKFSEDNIEALEARFGRLPGVINRAVGGYERWAKFRNILTNLGDVAKDSLAKLTQSGKTAGVVFDNSSRSVTNIKNVTQAATGAMKSFGSQVAIALGAFGLAYKAVGFFKDGIANASTLNETLSKTDAIFGKSADTIVSESNRMAQAFGVSKNEYITAAGNFGAVFKGLGKSQDEAAGLGNSLAKLAMDMASFDNTSNADAFGAISSALRGEMDPIERFRVFLNADKVAAEALALGLAKSKGEITDTAKKMATVSLIMRQTADAQGDLARTAGGTANQVRKLGGTMVNLGADVGAALMPAVDGAISLLGKVTSGLANVFARSKGTIEGFAASIAAGFATVGTVAEYLLPEFTAIGATIAGAFSDGAGAAMGFVPSLTSVATAAKGALQAFNTGLKATIDWFKSLPGRIDDTFGAGTTAKIGEMAIAIGRTAAALSVLGGAFSVVVAGATAILAPLLSVPVLAASAGVGLAYLTSSFTDLKDASSLVSFAVKNNTDMFAYWYLSVTDWINNVAENFKSLVKSVANFAMGKGWDFKAIELKPSADTEAAIEAMRKNTFDPPKKAVQPLVIPPLDTKAIQAQVAAIAKPPAPPAKTEAEVKKGEARNKELETFSKRFIDAVKTPIEKFNEAMKDAKEAFDAGMLTAEQYKKAEQFAYKEADFKTETKFTGAVKASSQEGYSALLQAASGRDFGGKDLSKPTNETARNTREMATNIRTLAQRENAKPMIFRYGA